MTDPTNIVLAALIGVSAAIVLLLLGFLAGLLAGIAAEHASNDR